MSLQTHQTDTHHKKLSVKTMRNPEHEMKLPTSTLRFHRQPINISKSPSSKESPSTSPTFARESCSKNLLEVGGGSHIFGIPPTIVTPQSSHSSSMMAMDYSLSSRTSSQSMIERMNESCSSTVGLPSDYPIHRKNTSCSSVALEEELKDFDIFLDENTSFERAALHSSSSLCGVESNCCGTLMVPSGTSPTKNDGPKKKRHRRLNSDLFSFDSLPDTTKSDQAHHRRHNYALSQKEFNESVLTQLFEDVATIAEVSY